MSQKQCSQCGKPAFIVYENKHCLCVDCNLKVEQAEQMQYIRHATEMNYLLGEMESRVGMPGLYPRYKLPQPNTYRPHDTA